MKTEIPLYDPIAEATGRKSEASKSAALSLLCALFLALTVPAAAQQPGKTPRIGLVSSASVEASPNVDPFRQGLREHGYLEGKNILVEYRYADGKPDRNSSLVAELVRLRVDVLVSGASPAILAAKQATKTIPIVMVIQQDPVVMGLIDSLARPGGNLTGLTLLTRGLSGKRLELLKETIPSVSRVGVLWSTPNNPGPSGFEFYESAARALKIPLQPLEVRGPNFDFEAAFQAATKEHVSALVIVRGGPALVYPRRIAELAIKHRLPSMNEGNDFVDAGGLMAYAASYSDAWRRAAIYVDKILKGARPADLPVEQPTKFELWINLKTAKQIGLTIPPAVLFRADRVIK
jgi:putative tryptophan/tyrosine transport system substrate-binding protein